MQFRKTVIWKDIFAILSQKVSPYKIGTWKAIVHTSKGNVEPLVINNIDIEKDYVNKVTETIILTFLLDKGTYLTSLYPCLENLEVTLYRYPHRDIPTSKIVNYDFKQKFKAIFLHEYNDRPRGTKDEMVSLAGTQLLQPVEVKLQLMNLNVEPLRLKWVTGSLLGYTQEMNLKSIIHSELNKVSLPTGKVIENVTIAKPDNSKPVKNLIIPSGTSLLDYPAWLQDDGMGVYNAGIGTFVTNTKNIQTNKLESNFYVYPTHKSVSGRPTLYLYVAPVYELGYNDKTFSIKGNTLHIVGHIHDGYIENRQGNELQNGVGFRLPSATSYMSKPVNITAAGPVASKENLNYKVATTSRCDGFNLAKRSANMTSANPYKHYSEYVKQVGNYVNFEWQQSDFTRLLPAMPVVLYRLVGNETIKEKGVLTQSTTIIQMKGKGIVDKSGYTETTILRFFVSSVLS